MSLVTIFSGAKQFRGEQTKKTTNAKNNRYRRVLLESFTEHSP